MSNLNIVCACNVAADADNDMIAFSSDDELMEAVKNVTDGILRVFISENAGPAAKQSATEALHCGITCDGCNGEVRGVRYKCLVCPDYDLCSPCASTGLHSDHEMLTIQHPMPIPGVSIFPVSSDLYISLLVLYIP